MQSFVRYISGELWSLEAHVWKSTSAASGICCKLKISSESIVNWQVLFFGSDVKKDSSFTSAKWNSRISSGSGDIRFFFDTIFWVVLRKKNMAHLVFFPIAPPKKCYRKKNTPNLTHPFGSEAKKTSSFTSTDRNFCISSGFEDIQKSKSTSENLWVKVRIQKIWHRNTQNDVLQPY